MAPLSLGLTGSSDSLGIIGAFSQNATIALAAMQVSNDAGSSSPSLLWTHRLNGLGASDIGRQIALASDNDGRGVAVLHTANGTI
eukprot:CAMPEP_0167799402 /NCGR_PEP_ID=MMETSP0111_2-20121227/16988_1 /TAXON_ID=91324 /ORGANISM="Lotharella globosa, Strain CCCM811" /LENGTH=84 /DNA_ID=CAMNT_0007694211 /DNA_START=65 /DNA_END=322 /DNA_ORIENTATION=-